MNARATTPKLETISPNFTRLTLNERTTIWFSYAEPVAFQRDDRLVLTENIWSTMTGTHINKISSDKGARLSRSEFLGQLATARLDNRENN